MALNITGSAQGQVEFWRDVRWFIAMSVCALVGLIPMIGNAAEYTIGPPPTWVVESQPGVPTTAQLSQTSDGVSYLLIDTQIRAAPDARTRYLRLVSSAINTKGVESIANIEIQFDPSYQSLVLHSINVVRDGRIIPKLATAKIRVFQRETELDARIYDGSKTVNVFLDDVRVGDTIDYSYSTTGRNPVFKGLEFGALEFQYAVPIAHIHARLMLPAGEAVTMTARHTPLKAVVTHHDGFRDHTWDIANVPALTIEQGAPNWYTPYPEIEWSQFANWAAVTRWAQPLYHVPDKLSPALENEVDRIAKSETTHSGRMLAALRLAQGEIRYLGVETGRNSHAPNPPALVFDRRFGDCKDKALLTLALLNRLGIDAHAALVNTTTRRGITDVLPNPAAFDHVLVQALVDGKVYWIDPTRPTQNSDLAHLFQPDYGVALVVDAATQTFTAMKDLSATPAKRSVHIIFDARDDFGKPVRYTVVTTNEAEAAELQRASLSSMNVGDVQKNYLQYYAKSYPGITVAAPLVINDDKINNRITTTETYTIANMASKPDKNGRHTVDISTPDTDELLRDPAITIRKAPLQVNYPLNVSQTTEVLLPSEWPITPSTASIEDPAFTFERTLKTEGLRFIITDHFHSLTDEIAAKDTARYTGNLARARNELGYQLYWTDPAAPSTAKGFDRMNWPIALLALAAFAIWSWLAVVVYRFEPPLRNDYDDDLERLQGIRGWLLLLAFGLLIAPIRIGSLLGVSIKAMSADTWARLTTYGSASYHAAWAPLLLFELVANLGLLMFSLLLLVLFFQRRRSFPIVGIAIFSAGFLVQGADLMLASLLPMVSVDSKDYAALVRTCFSIAIWSAYLLRSRRVKWTFVKPRPISASASNIQGHSYSGLDSPPAMPPLTVEQG